jgi:membrane protein required for colicin V production
MTWLDYAVLVVVAISIAWGVYRGLVHEVMSLAGWVIAFLAANLFSAPLSATLPQSIARPELRVLVAFMALFIGTLVVTTLATFLLDKLVQSTGLGNLDRLLGALFGLARGLVIALAFALLAGLTTLPQQRIWTDSASASQLEQAATALKPWLPPAFAERLRYH